MKKGATKQRSKKRNNKRREQRSKGTPIVKHSSAKQKLGPIYTQECEIKASVCFQIMALPKA